MPNTQKNRFRSRNRSSVYNGKGPKVFGNNDKFIRWVTSPNQALGNEIPSKLAQTKLAAKDNIIESICRT